MKHPFKVHLPHKVLSKSHIEKVGITVLNNRKPPKLYCITWKSFLEAGIPFYHKLLFFSHIELKVVTNLNHVYAEKHITCLCKGRHFWFHPMSNSSLSQSTRKVNHLTVKIKGCSTEDPQDTVETLCPLNSLQGCYMTFPHWLFYFDACWAWRRSRT